MVWLNLQVCACCAKGKHVSSIQRLKQIEGALRAGAAAYVGRPVLCACMRIGKFGPADSTRCGEIITIGCPIKLLKFIRPAMAAALLPNAFPEI